MHYYMFNIGDYLRDTAHLDEMEDLAYRRMLDLYYQREKALPADQKEIARLIRMRTHSECIANVLREFFDLTNDGYINRGAEKVLNKTYAKSEAARKSAKARWNKNKDLANANAMQTECEGDANDMLPITHYPLPNTQDKDIVAPAKAEAIPYQQILQVYREKLVTKGMTDCVKLTDKRKNQIRKFWNQFDMTTAKWSAYCNCIASNCSWMFNGHTGANGVNYKKKDLMFIAKEDTILKVREKTYYD